MSIPPQKHDSPPTSPTTSPATSPPIEAARDAPTAAQLRRDIDTGQARDKVAAEDPAAAPLGTDDEAAGNPVTPRQAEMARQAEVRPRVQPDRTRSRHLAFSIAVLVALALLIALAWWSVAAA